MSYLVLARKYRPRHFGEMVGQEHVVRALKNALDTQRLHHAYLFTGTRGVGKTTVSRILAKSLNCVGADGNGGVTSTPCGACQACTEIDAGRFIDYTELDAASNRGVDDVQTLLEQAVYKPVQGRFKVFMIDEVHMLTNTAFNAMLKTLEEPPEYLKFVLATTDPQKVPVTVLSRCLQFNLRPMAPETVREHLQRVLELENVVNEPQALQVLARAARGSMRDALSLTDQAIAFGSGQLTDATVQQMLGSADRATVLRLIEALAEADGARVVQAVDDLRRDGLHPASTLEEMSVVLQRMAVLQAAPDAVDDNDPDGPEIQRLAELLPADETQLLYSICLHGRAELGLAPDEYAGLTMVLLRLLAFKPAGEAAAGAAAEKKNRRNERGEGLTPRPAAKLAPTAVEAPPRKQEAPVAPPVSVVPAAPAVVPASVPSAAAPRPVPAASQARTEPEPPPWDDIPSAEPDGVADAAPADVVVPESIPVDRPSGNPVKVAAPPPPPAGHVLPVVDALVRPAQPLAPARSPREAAPEIVPVTVRAHSDAGPEPARAASRLMPTEEGDFWHRTVQQLIHAEAITALVRELALQSQLVARDTDQWLLRVERESLNMGNTRERLQTALRGAGHAVALVVEVGRVTDSPARRNQAAQEERQLAAERLVFEDPFVQAMMRDFGAKIVPGSIKPV